MPFETLYHIWCELQLWLWKGGGLPWILKSFLQLCVSGSATLENLKCQERPIFWQQAPVPCVAIYGKHIFSVSGESLSVRRLE